MAGGRFPTTDYGTVILHWIIVASFVVLLLTGLRIASDDPDCAWLKVFDPLLPMEHLWFRHLLAGTVLAAACAGYAVFVARARLAQRIRFDRGRIAAFTRGGKPAIAALNCLVMWILLAALATEIATGVLLFLGWGGATLSWHLMATWIALAAVGLHVALHAAYGGVQQLLRIVRPAPLIIQPPPPDFAELLAQQLRRDAGPKVAERPAAAKNRDGTLYAHPFAIAVTTAFAVVALAAELESVTRPVLRVVEVSAKDAPVLDGDLSDPVWRLAPPVSILTTQGGDFGGSGESLVEVRAVHDGEFAYFAFVWSDPTRSLKHLPLVKDEDGWRIARSGRAGRDLRQPPELLEDKFAVLLTRPALPLIGAAIHLAVAPLPGKPGGRDGRGLHYTDGRLADVWQWRASHAGSIGYIENCHIAGPADQPAHVPGGEVTRYSGGFHRDPERPVWQDNMSTPPESSSGIVRPLRLPRDPAALQRAMGRLSDDVDKSESEGSRWWMSEAETTAYSAAGDSKLPVGSVIPSIVMLDGVATERSSIRGVARWAAGRWTLELSRRLHTGSPYDLAIKTGTLMWVAAFDHSETRHTRHLRPLRLEVD